MSKVRNVANTPQETTFSVVIPDTAFISGFSMEINGKNYTAIVKEKEEAEDIYAQVTLLQYEGCLSTLLTFLLGC